MGSIYLRKYGVATTVDFCLYELDGTDLQVGAVSAAGDVTLNRDEAGVETLDANAFTDLGSGYSLALSLAEMQAARIIVYIIDQSNPKIWLDKVLIIETYGHTSAQHPFDLGTPTVNLSAATETQIDNLDGHITADYTATEKTAIDLLDDAAGGLADVHSDLSIVHANVVNMGADVNDILVDTDELQTDWHNGGRLDLLLDEAITDIIAVDGKVDLIKAVTDTLSLATIADAVHDETVEGAYTLRQLIRLIAAALCGELSGAGTGTLTFTVAGGGANRIVATVDANNNRTATALSP